MASLDTTPADFIRERIQADQAGGAFDGRVQTRFPPEPNGFLHIGHAKSIYLNFGIAEEFGGRVLPPLRRHQPRDRGRVVRRCHPGGPRLAGRHAGEASLGTRPTTSSRSTRGPSSSIAKGLAYVDDQDKETISAQRGGFGQPGVESPHRDRSVEENLGLFRQMRDGAFADGAKVLRAKIDMQADNMWLRDPVLYRIRQVPHHRTGDRWVHLPDLRLGARPVRRHRGHHALDLHARVLRPPGPVRLVSRSARPAAPTGPSRPSSPAST